MSPVQSWSEGRPLKPLAGGSMDPRDIVGREATIAHMKSLLARGVDLVVNDPRRMGKTCLLDRLAFMTAEPWMTVKIDYEGVKTCDEFLRRTIDGLRTSQRLLGRVVAAVRPYMDNVEAKIGGGPLAVSAAFRWRSPSDLLDITVLRIDGSLKGDEKVILAMDEVPLAIENIAKNESPVTADTLFQTLRRLRKATRNIRWIVTGSVGFHHVLRLAGSSEGAINDLQNVPCGPLDRVWASELGAMLLMGIDADFDDEALDALVDAAGGILFLLHQVANLLPVGKRCTPAAVDVAWQTYIEDRDQSRASTYLLTRLPGYYGDRVAIAEKVLDLLAISTEPVSPRQIAVEVEGATEVFDDLEDDHYLATVSGGLTWRYAVLRRAWLARRRLG